MNYAYARCEGASITKWALLICNNGFCEFLLFANFLISALLQLLGLLVAMQSAGEKYERYP